MKVRGCIALLLSMAALTFMLLLKDCGGHRRQAVADEVRAAEARRIARATQEENNRRAREREQEGQRAFNAGMEAVKRGFYPEAVIELEKSRQLGNAVAANNLAWLFATCEDPAQHNGKRAVELALEATKLLPGDAYAFGTLAAAYARNGQFEQAVSTQIRALSIGSIQGGEERLKLYRQQKAYPEESAAAAKPAPATPPKPLLTHEELIAEIRAKLARGEEITADEATMHNIELMRNR